MKTGKTDNEELNKLPTPIPIIVWDARDKELIRIIEDEYEKRLRILEDEYEKRYGPDAL